MIKAMVLMLTITFVIELIVIKRTLIVLIIIMIMIRMIIKRKEGRNGLLRRFLQLSLYMAGIETRNLEDIPFSSRIDLRGLLVAEEA